ncbi:MAG: extracellular solute-binding protein [Clostridia bacterium]|nr:extracellular solute-binding protein [Clostridia bacterium]
MGSKRAKKLCQQILSVMILAVLSLSMISCSPKQDDKPSDGDGTVTTTTTGSDVGGENNGGDIDPNVTTTVGSGDTTVTQVQGGTSSGKLFDKQVTFTVMTQEHPSQKVNPSGIKYTEILEKTNVKLEFDITPQASWNTKMTAALVSGALSDITWVDLDSLREYAEKNIFLDLTPYMEKELSNYYRFIKDDSEAKKTKIDGKVYGLITVNGDYYPSQPIDDRHTALSCGGVMPVIRYDILEKHNLKMPTTFDEWFDTMKQLKVLYPESAPWSGRIRGINAINYMSYAMSGYYPGLHYNHDQKKYTYGVLNSDFRKVIEFLRSCWEEGIMDNNMWSVNANLWTENVVSGNTFFWLDNAGFAALQNEQLKESNPKANLQIMPLMANDQGVKRGELYSQNWYTQLYVISAKSTKKDQIVKFMNWCYSDEGMWVTNYGKEGVTFTKDDKGNVTIPESIAKNYVNSASPAYNYSSDLGVGMLSFTPLVHNNVALNNALEKLGAVDLEYSKQIDRVTQADVKAGNYKAQVIDVALEKGIRAKTMTKEDAIFTLMNTQLRQFIDGRLPMTQYDSFVAQVKKLGAEDVVKAYNDALAKVK